MTITQKIEQQKVALTTAAKMSKEKRKDQEKSSKNRESYHTFQIGYLVLVKKHNMEKT